MIGHIAPQITPPLATTRRRMMQLLAFVALSTAGWLMLSIPAQAATSADTPQGEAARDGSHDFDFNIGKWHTHIRRVLDPFAASKESIDLYGTVTVRPVWGGRAQLEEIEADGPKGHWEGLSLFLYNPQSHQWSQTFINSKTVDFGPPLIGEFKDGRAEVFSSDTFKGKAILVRGIWSNIAADSHQYAEDYSNDGGTTWAPSFHAELTRDTNFDSQIPPMDAASDAGQHDFDFDLGSWKTHSSRLLNPLTGSTKWVQMEGISKVSKVWNGRANLAEYKADGPAGPIELLALRWFNPTTHEWNIDFATPGVGTLGIPGIGAFKNGRADFYDYEPINGRSVLVRFSIWGITADTAQSEQAFSVDGGKTWEVNWINKYERAHSE
jgi:hypothetical protein